MDWTKETQDMFKIWVDGQTKTWQTWLKGVQEFDVSKPGEVWAKTIDAWQESIKSTLAAQVESSHIWAESLTSMEGAPKESADWAKQIEQMTQEWTNLQGQLWNNWFEMIRKVDPSQFGGSWDKQGNELLKAWQDMVKKAIDTQNEWMKNATAMGEKKGS